MLSRTAPARSLVLGVYGGICSGKSLTCGVLETCGAAVIDVDKVAHKAYAPGTACQAAVVAEFGTAVATPEGGIHRPSLGKIVFEDATGARLQRLNEIVWPEVQKMTAGLVAERRGTHDVVAVEAALMMEAGWHTICDRLWMFHVRPEVALHRLTTSRHLSPQEAAARLGKQLPNADREALVAAHFPPDRRWVYDRSDTSVEEATRAITAQYAALVRA
eukprot:TRINITY_DN30382_c0_g1_i1.p2 TRINITY_DN30382_c0_g1~~TRINITY_DN30382_c0_g1_i1.p2  ORF type:complete len:218 (+),score=71.04 TRINITY_DN30382_c0_g1_i1:40-693(+)